MNLAGNSRMYMSVQRWSDSLIKINEFSPVGYPAGTLFVCRRAMSAGEQTEGPAPRQLFFTKGYCDHPGQSNIRVIDGSTEVSKREARFSHAKL